MPSAQTPVHGLLETAEDLLTPAEVARLFRVDPKTVARWERDGRLASVRTLGGHRRYPKPQLNALLHTRTPATEIIRALDELHALATDTGAHTEAAHIARLIDTLRTGPAETAGFTHA